MTRATGAPKPLQVSDAPLSDAQLADAHVWMQAARAWVIERYPYLDTAVTSMLLVPRPGLGTVAVDARWRLYYDPARTLALAQQHGIATLASDWVHEVMHLLRDHHERWDGMCQPPAQHVVFNIAGDAFVNADCADMGLPLLPTDITFDTLPQAAGCERTMTTEDVYIRLLNVVRIVDHAGHDCGSGVGGGRRQWEESLADEVDDGSPSADQADVVREETARSITQAAKDQGDVPQGLRVWADALLEPTVDWRAELRSVVSRRLGHAAGVKDYSFSRLARRRIPGFTLPGMVGAAPPRVAAVIDTSGSMLPQELAQCLGDLLGLSRAVSGDGASVTVVVCDAEVQGIHQVRTPNRIRDLELTGGGGTDMREGLAACAKLRTAPEVIVVMTDGYTPWPATPPQGLGSAVVIALVTQADSVRHVPSWIRVIPAR
jgi:predicted metal-dependent peptidase